MDENEDMATYYALRSRTRTSFDAESTTLVQASERGYLAVVKCLLERGADVNKAGDVGMTP